MHGTTNIKLIAWDGHEKSNDSK